MRQRRRTAILQPDFTAESKCPDCGHVNILDVPHPVRPLNTVRARAHCPCGRSYGVDLERRCGVRKPLIIQGQYRRRGDKMARPMTIQNVSRSGIRFEPDDGRALRMGEHIEVDFTFGQPKSTYVHKRAKILRHANGSFGAEFAIGKKRDPLSLTEDLELALHNPAIRTA